MYVCGPTVYSDIAFRKLPHLCRFDIIYRYLLHLGYKVRYVRILQMLGIRESDGDVGEDKISKKAKLFS